MSKKVTILKGLPASGKSTWAKEQVQKSQGGCKRVNKDDLCSMIDGGKYSKGNERFVLTMRNRLIFEALNAGKHVIVDDTNLYPKHEEDIRELVRSYNACYNNTVTVEVKVFNTSVEECIARDLKREESVGSKVILTMARQWSPDGKCYKAPIPEIDLDTIDRTKKWVVIYDLDGTAAILGDRNPYDASRCDEVDRPNVALREVLVRMAASSPDLDFIALSGRSSDYRDQTERFLKVHVFPYDELYMRESGDNRKDAVIKGELFDAFIRDKYNVLVVFDDRNQMVDFWRKEVGVPCFQVNYGDF
jgi:predicted kinase